ncbi:MAG: HD domain-containing protein [Chitinophagaceae bacterium]|nr:HD domain-containing protein [Chitinophagaceae bacterium]
MNEEILLQDCKQFVTDLFEDKVSRGFFFHNIRHTQTVVKAVEDMAIYYQLQGEDRLAVLVAAWFHDTGYSQGVGSNHEEESVRIAAAYLEKKEIPPAVIEKVSKCIMATKMPQSPNSLIEQIICDADLSHLGTQDFEKESKLLRKEFSSAFNKDISKKDWRKENIQFFQSHRYFTDYGRSRLEPVKQEHLHEMLGHEKEKDEKGADEKNKKDKTVKEQHIPEVKSPVSEKPEKDKQKESRTERGTATMFRIMSDNHVSLSQMADSKANIMISVNTIVLSILVSVLFGKLQYYPQFIIPTIILASVCLAAIIFAILATRPNITRGTFNKEDVQQKKVNLLFFGNFHKMDLPDYDWAMKEMMNDREYLYGSMIKDIYFLGIVLAKKYRRLRTSYTIFMYGLIIAIVAFIVAAIIGTPS